MQGAAGVGCPRRWVVAASKASHIIEAVPETIAPRWSTWPGGVSIVIKTVPKEYQA